MDSQTDSPEGLLQSLRKFGGILLAGVRERIALASLELQEEKIRLFRLFILASLLVFTSGMALALGSLTIVCLFWDNARLAALGGLTLFFAVVAMALLFLVRRDLSRQFRPFAETLEELEADQAWIRGRD